MHETTVKLSEEAVAALEKAVATPEVKEVIEATKAAGDTGTFSVIISTEHEDRMQEVIKQDGWQLERYLANPVVLWGHDHRSLPIGIATNLEVTEFEGKPALKATGKFAEHEFAQTVRKLYDAKVVRSTSVGFIPKKFDENDMSIITIAELLEFSFVSVPANPFALSTLNQAGYTQAQVGELLTKGFLNTDVKAEDEPEAPAEEPETPADEPENPEPTDEPEVPADEPTEAPEDEKAATTEKDKGAVADEAQAQEDREKKWENFTKVDDIIFAFWKTYFDSDTPVDAFKGMLDETIGLLQQVSNSEKEFKFDGLIKEVEESGMRAVRENSETFKGLDITTLKSIVLALEAMIPAEKQEEPEGGEGDEPEESANSPEPVSEEAQLALAFLSTRKGVQQIASMASDLLRDARKEAEKHY